MNETEGATRLSTPEEQQAAARKRLRAEEARRMRRELSEWVAYSCLICGSLLVLGIACWKTEEMFRQPLKFPFAVQYASVDSETLDYELDFSDEGGIPASARRTPKPERRQPFMVVAGSPGAAQFEQALEPAQKDLELVVPRGVAPGDWSGKLRFHTKQGALVADMPVSFHVADPWRLWKIGGGSFVAFTFCWYALLVYFRPSLRAWLLWLDLTPHERREAPDPRKKQFGVGWFRRWLLLPRRHWVSLRELHPRMPSGRLLAVRRGLLPGRKRTFLKMELDAVESTPLVFTHHWPKSTKAVESLGGKPSPRIDITSKGSFSGQPWCIVGTRDGEGNALAFSIAHPDGKNPRQSTST